MSRKKKLLALGLVLALLLCLLPVNAAAQNTAESLTAAAGIAINQTKNLAVGGSKPLILTAAPAGSTLPEVTWSSSSPATAAVDQNGVVTGVSPGQVTITAASETDSTITASVQLLVRTAYPYRVGWSGSFTSADNNTAASADLPVSTSRTEKAWQAQVGNGTIAIVDDSIYTYDGTNQNGDTSAGGTFYKLSRDTGAIEASLKCSASSGYYYSYTIYGGGLLYVACSDTVMAFDPDSFTLLWSVSVPEKDYTPIQYVGHAVVTNGTVLNAATGAKLASLTGTYHYASGAEVNGKYYIASAEGILYAFSTDTWQAADSISFRTGTLGIQPGVMYNAGRLYWGGDAAYSISLDSSGLLQHGTLKKTDCGITSVCTPAAAGSRVYLAGTKDGAGVVGVFSSADMSLLYLAGGAGKKIQSTPILRAVSPDGPVVSSAGTNGTLDASTQSSVPAQTFVYVQDYQSPSTVYVLLDTPSAVSGSLTPLAQLDPAQYAYEQLACDTDGALYCTNDAGYLLKYRKSAVSAPVFTGDLSTAEVRYQTGAAAEALIVSASSADGGTLSWQWQSRREGTGWTDLAGQTASSLVPDTSAAGITYYRCLAVNTLDGASASTASKIAKIRVTDAGSALIHVTFRLIGAGKSSAAIDFSSAFGDYHGSAYQQWIPEMTYCAEAGTTVGELIATALKETGFTIRSSDTGGIEAVTQPAALGGASLANGDNGTRACWMYSLNGLHTADSDTELKENDALILHYTNDTSYEPGDLLAAGIDRTYADFWLKAESPAVKKGDVNADGSVDGKDVAVLRRYLVEWPGVGICSAAANVNSTTDELVNNLDVAILRRYLVNWPGVRLV
jgi:hypothetical protein